MTSCRDRAFAARGAERMRDGPVRNQGERVAMSRDAPRRQPHEQPQRRGDKRSSAAWPGLARSDARRLAQQGVGLVALTDGEASGLVELTRLCLRCKCKALRLAA